MGMRVGVIGLIVNVLMVWVVIYMMGPMVIIWCYSSCVEGFGGNWCSESVDMTGWGWGTIRKGFWGWSASIRKGFWGWSAIKLHFMRIEVQLRILMAVIVFIIIFIWVPLVVFVFGWVWWSRG